MKLVCGVVDRSGCRRIFTARCTPTLEDLEDRSLCSADTFYDWGPAAALRESEWTAATILSVVTDRAEAVRLAAAYAEQIVRPKLSAERMWILSLEEIGQWLRANRKVA